MSTDMEPASVPATQGEKFYRWIRALDEALEFDPVEQQQISVRDLNNRMRKLEAVVRRLEMQANAQNE